jgi:hypothetical protein
MLKTVSAYDNLTGDRKIGLYNEGESYEMSTSLFNDLVNDGAVTLESAPLPPSAKVRETKVITVAEIKPMTPKEAKEAAKAAKKSGKAD